MIPMTAEHNEQVEEKLLAVLVHNGPAVVWGDKEQLLTYDTHDS